MNTSRPLPKTSGCARRFLTPRNASAPLNRSNPPPKRWHSSLARGGSVFFVGDDVAAHQDVVVADGLHVLDVLGQHKQLVESALLKHTTRGFLSVEKLGFELLEADVAGDVDEFVDEDAG